MSTVDANGASGLTTAEVAEILGVKRQTVYAYVSRGILHRQLAMDGRTSLFNRAEVEELRVGRKPDQDGVMRTMLTTRLTQVSDEGLWVRGRDLVAMVNGGASFTDVADLLWDSPPEEAWPSPRPASGPQDPGSPAAALRSPVAVLGLPEMTLLDRLRVVVAAESSADPMRHDLTPRSVRAAGRRAIVAMATGLGDPAHRATPATGSDGPDTGPTAGRGNIGDTLWQALGPGPADEAKRRTVDVALSLLADHGMAGSTLAARVAASVRADPYSVVISGLGVIGGTLHGAASAAVHELYLEAHRSGDPAEVVGRIQSRRGAVPGFGHMVYKTQDGRYGALMTHLVEAWADDPRLQTVFRVRDVVGERSDAIPNIDLALGALTFLAEMPSHSGEAVFAIARTAGWLAHAMEEYDEKALRFRAKGRYIGNPPGR